ncbi:MAG TPA: cupin domain-containing protein [Oculatellaceae cyanobacterium]
MSLKEQCLDQKISTKHGQNYSAISPGSFSKLVQYKLKHPLIPDRLVPGKLFLKDHINLTGMQISLGTVPSGKGTPFTHAHKLNEEVYIFVRGKGQMLIDNEIIEVEEGSAVRVAPAGVRAFRNTSEEELHYIVIQAKEHSLSQDTFDDGIPGANPPSWPD